MNQLLTDNTLIDFERVTNFPITNFLTSFVTFIQNDYPYIISYYNGDIKTPNNTSFNNLNNLIDEVLSCIEVINIHKKHFKDFSYWNLLEQIENIQIKLLTIENFSFYLRSYINSNSNQFSLGTEVDIVMKQYDTIENIEISELNSDNGQNDWYDLALYNLLTEEDYKSKGGAILKVYLAQSNNSIYLNSVLGALQGISLYGIDISAQTLFLNNDIAVDTPLLTIQNAINRYLNMVKGDNAEFPNDGLQVSLFIGNNINSLLFPVMFRKYTNLFGKDDTIAIFSITNIKRQANGINIDFEIESAFGERFPENKIL